MTEEASKVANSLGMWLACIPMVAIALFQSYIFMKKAWKAGLEMGLSRDQLKTGMRAGAISSIGPACTILISLVALIAIVGGALAWLRLSVIGSIMYEGLAANTALDAMGTAVGDPGFNVTALANCVWVMAIGSCGWVLVSGLFTHKMDSVRMKIVGGNSALLPVITACCALGAIGYQSAKQLLTFSRSAIVVIVSAAVIVLLDYLTKKTGKKWIKEWSLGICILVGMFAGIIGLSA